MIKKREDLMKEKENKKKCNAKRKLIREQRQIYFLHKRLKSHE
jgi:hypothetical protein